MVRPVAAVVSLAAVCRWEIIIIISNHHQFEDMLTMKANKSQVAFIVNGGNLQCIGDLMTSTGTGSLLGIT